MRDLFGNEVAPALRKGQKGYGCAYCPQNKNPLVTKLKGLERITGRRAMLWAESPGRTENDKGLELIGKAGQFLWQELASFGLTRDHFDVQNVVRCWPIDLNGVKREPSNEELRCCSIYNDQALNLNRQRAHVHLILGEIAGRQLLGSKYRKDRPFVWMDEWEAYAVTAHHPSFLLRVGGRDAGHHYLDFKDRLKAVAACLKHPGRWGYVKAQDYAAVTTDAQMTDLEKRVRSEVKLGRRVGADIEDDTFDGEPKIFRIGFGYGNYKTKNRKWDSWEGGARSVVTHGFKGSDRLMKRACALLEDASIKKVLQHGSYDVPQIKRIAGATLRGYDYDSEYAAYLYNSQMRSYSIANLCRRWFQEFFDYKDITNGYSNRYSQVPFDLMTVYNCADSDIVKRVEAKTIDRVSLALLYVYIHVAFTLDGMEERGPLLDWEEHDRIGKALPEMIKPLERRLKHLAEFEDFKPNTPAQIAWLIYDKLKIPPMKVSKRGKPEKVTRSTGADILKLLAAEHERLKPIVHDLILPYRTLQTVKNTFWKGYAASAEKNNGELHTIWWLCGAATGRLRSGKGEEAESEGILNMQNMHSNPILQNMVVSDPEWRRALEE